MANPTRALDVPLHAGVDVCLCLVRQFAELDWPMTGAILKCKSLPHLLPPQCAVYLDITSRENFNPHFRTFSIA